MLCNWGAHNVLGGGAQTEKIQQFFKVKQFVTPKVLQLGIWTSVRILLHCSVLLKNDFFSFEPSKVLYIVVIPINQSFNFFLKEQMRIRCNLMTNLPNHATDFLFNIKYQENTPWTFFGGRNCSYFSLFWCFVSTTAFFRLWTSFWKNKWQTNSLFCV